MNENTIRQSNLEFALLRCIRSLENDEHAMGYVRPSALLVALRENLAGLRKDNPLVVIP